MLHARASGTRPTPLEGGKGVEGVGGVKGAEGAEGAGVSPAAGSIG